MKIYLAARYSRADEMQEVAAVLRDMGHDVTSRWHRGDHKLEDYLVGTEEGLDKQLSFATDDINDLHDADCVVNFAEPLRTPSRGGRLVEQGLAIAWGMWTIKVGGHETVFDALPCVYHVANASELYQLVGEVA